jgi:hypothetical protein
VFQSLHKILQIVNKPTVAIEILQRTDERTRISKEECSPGMVSRARSIGTTRFVLNFAQCVGVDLRSYDMKT